MSGGDEKGNAGSGPALPTRCPECGVLMDQPWDDSRPRLNHEPGSKSCKVRAWGAEAKARNLMRVEGEDAILLAELGVPIVYGPVAMTQTLADRLASGRAQRTFVSSAFVPVAAYYLMDAFGRSLLPRAHDRLCLLLRHAEKDAEFANAIAAVAALSDKLKERRAAVMALTKGPL